jgi:N-glycosylase/DNA lyase
MIFAEKPTKYILDFLILALVWSQVLSFSHRNLSSMMSTMSRTARRSQRLVHQIVAPLGESRSEIDAVVTPRTTGRRALPVTPSPKKRPRKDEKPPSPSSRQHKAPEKPASASITTTNITTNLQLTTDMVAAINPSQPFVDLQVSPQELRPSATLTTGQCFHWQVVHPSSSSNHHYKDNTKEKVSAWGIHNATDFIGTIRLDEKESVVVSIRETPTTTLSRPLAATTETVMNTETLHQRLREYFQLHIPLQPLYNEWSVACPRMAIIADCIPGVRIIDQDPWECLVSFICSSNNNIPRITKMLGAIRKVYGTPLLSIQKDTFEFYSFPSLEDLHKRATDQDLRTKCGMGYRAKYLMETIKILKAKGGEAYLKEELRNVSNPVEVQKKLCEFCGVGPKVADCVALFSLRQDDAIPVDTHVWNIALRDYDSEEISLSSILSLTPTNYQRVGDVFRQRFNNRAGWAHSLLFVAELPSFRAVLPPTLIEEMDNFRILEQEKKQQKKQAKSKG